MATAQNLFVNIETNGLDGATTYTFRRNAGDTPVTLSVGAAATGFFEDLVNTDDYDENDLVDYEISAAGTVGTIRTNVLSAQSEAPGGTVWTLAGISAGSAFAQGTTRFAVIAGELLAIVAEVRIQTRLRVGLTWDRLGVRVITNTLNVAATITSRIDSADGNQTVSIAATDTGLFEDTTNSDSPVSGEQINWTSVIPAGAGSMTVSFFSSQILASPTTQILQNPEMQLVGSGFSSPITGGNISGSPEDEAEVTIRFAATWRRLVVQIFANTQAAPSTTIRSRINEAYGTLIVTIPAGMTGEFEDNVNTDSVSAGNELDWLEEGGSGANLQGMIQSSFDPDANQFTMMTSGIESTTFATTEFVTIQGRLIGVAAEADVQAGSPLAAPGVGGGGVGGSALILFR